MALHLVEKGYRDVTIFDHQNFDELQYSPFRGSDSASSGTLEHILDIWLQITNKEHRYYEGHSISVWL